MAGYYRQTGMGELALPSLRLTAPTLEKNEERSGRPSKSDALCSIYFLPDSSAPYALRPRSSR